MKVHLLSTAILLFLPTLAAAGSDSFGRNQIGIFMTEADVDSAHTMLYGVGPVELQVILLNPFNEATGEPLSTIGGFEFGVSVTYGPIFAQINLVEGLVNLLEIPEVRVAGPQPVADGQCLLGTLVIGSFTGMWAGSAVTLVPVTDAALPGQICVFDADDDMHPIAVMPWTGHDCPLFFFWENPILMGFDAWAIWEGSHCVVWGTIQSWSTGYVADEAISFGTLKALYR